MEETVETTEEAEETEETSEEGVLTEEGEAVEKIENIAEEEVTVEAVDEREVEKEKRKEVEEVIEEKFYTIPLRKAWIPPRKKRAPKAIRIVKSFIRRHMKLRTDAEEEGREAEKLIIRNEVNQKIWRRGIQKPPRRIKVRAVRDKEGRVIVYLAEGD